VSVSFSVEHSEHGAATNDASGSWEDRIVVAGTITGSDGGKTAQLRDVEYDAETATLSIRIETTDDPDADAFVTQSLLRIDYRLVVESDDPIDRIVVEHGGVGHDGTDPWSTTLVREGAAD